MKKLIFTIALILFVIDLFSQAPSAFNYQAVLRDASGNIKSNTAASVRIDILQGSITGTSVYAESFAVTTNLYGLINLQVGRGTVISGTFSTINWGNNAYFIKVSVDGTAMGTSQLLSVPYALFSKNSDGGWKINGNAGTDTIVNFIGTTDDKPVLFKVNGTSSMVLNKNGKLSFENTGYSIFIGKGVGKHDDLTRKFNVFIGDSAGYSNTAGYNNLAVGYCAFLSNTTGGNNITFGKETLYSNTTGSNNTAFGSWALRTNTTGNNNTAIGAYSLFDNTTGYENVSIGNNTLQTNITGRRNTAIGFVALHNNTTGSNNTAVGYWTLVNNTTGTNNIAVGSNALYKNTIGRWNIAIGDSALEITTTNDKNIAIGHKALNKNIGWDNTAIGYASLIKNSGGFDNVAVGDEALNSNVSGNGNTAVGKYTMVGNVTGSNNTSIGFHSDVAANASNSTAIGYDAYVNSSNKIRLGNASVTVIEGQVGFTNASDMRLKKNIKDIGSGTDFIMKLRPVEYQMQQGNEKVNFGFIAQDIEKLLGTNNNLLTVGEDKDRTLGLRYTDFIAPMVKAMQEQQKQIEDQQKLINQLIQEVEKLKSSK